MTQRNGDFHTSNQSAAYFTYNKEYARNCAGPGGTIIRQDVPREMLRQGYKFDDVPDDDWYHVRTYLLFRILQTANIPCSSWRITGRTKRQ